MCQKCETATKQANETASLFNKAWNDAVDFMTKADTETLSEPAFRAMVETIAERAREIDTTAARQFVQGRISLDDMLETFVQNFMMALLIGINLGAAGYVPELYKCEDVEASRSEGKNKFMDLGDILFPKG